MNLRPDTVDSNVFREVITDNCYRVPDSLEGGIVIDVGAQIGCFSKLCADRGAGQVLAYEIEADNITMFHENLKDYPQVKLFAKAVWGVGGIKVNTSGMYMTADGSLKNTGSSHVTTVAGPHTVEGQIETITLDEILEPFEHVALVKLDCESAEFEIVPATKSWAKVERLVGECHGYAKQYSRPDFYMEIKRHFPKLEVVSYCPEFGLDQFFASR